MTTSNAMSGAFRLRRMFSDEAGDTRFDTLDLPMVLKEHAPPAGPFLATEHQQALSFTFFRLPSKWVGDAHPVPFKCLVVCLTGQFRFVSSTGATVVMKPGDRLIETDTTGKGRITEVLSDEPVECLIVRLE